MKIIIECINGKWRVNNREFKDMTQMEKETLDKFIKSYDKDFTNEH